MRRRRRGGQHASRALWATIVRQRSRATGRTPRRRLHGSDRPPAQAVPARPARPWCAAAAVRRRVLGWRGRAAVGAADAVPEGRRGRGGRDDPLSVGHLHDSREQAHGVPPAAPRPRHLRHSVPHRGQRAAHHRRNRASVARGARDRDPLQRALLRTARGRGVFRGRLGRGDRRGLSAGVDLAHAHRIHRPAAAAVRLPGRADRRPNTVPGGPGPAAAGGGTARVAVRLQRHPPTDLADEGRPRALGPVDGDHPVR